VLAVDFHLDRPHRAVMPRVGRGIPEQVLIGQLLDDRGERLAEGVDVFGEPGPSLQDVK
jgi:hypothetical protein